MFYQDSETWYAEDDRTTCISAPYLLLAGSHIFDGWLSEPKNEKRIVLTDEWKSQQHEDAVTSTMQRCFMFFLQFFQVCSFIYGWCCCCRSPSCIAVRAQKAVMLFDCGEDAQRQLIKQPQIVHGRVNRIFVTSNSSENIYGIPGKYNFYWAVVFSGFGCSQDLHIFECLGWCSRAICSHLCFRKRPCQLSMNVTTWTQIGCTAFPTISTNLSALHSASLAVTCPISLSSCYIFFITSACKCMLAMEAVSIKYPTSLLAMYDACI